MTIIKVVKTENGWQVAFDNTIEDYIYPTKKQAWDNAQFLAGVSYEKVVVGKYQIAAE